MTPISRTSTPVQLWLIYCYTGRTGVLVDGIHYLEPQQFCVVIRARAIPRHFLIWMRTVGQLRHADYCGAFMFKYAFHRWTRQIIHNTLIVVDRYPRLMQDKAIPDLSEPRLESFHPPFVAGIDQPHQGVVDSYTLYNGNPYTDTTAS